MIPRSAPIARNVRPRRKRRGTRRGPWRSEAYRHWIASQPCIICGDERTQAAHTEHNGMGSKGPDSSCVPLCPFHHDQADGRRDLNGRYGKASFQRAYGVSLKSVAAGFFLVWNCRNQPEPPCECDLKGDTADARPCELHNPSSKFNRTRPERIAKAEVVDVCPF